MFSLHSVHLSNPPVWDQAAVLVCCCKTSNHSVYKWCKTPHIYLMTPPGQEPLLYLWWLIWCSGYPRLQGFRVFVLLFHDIKANLEESCRIFLLHLTNVTFSGTTSSFSKRKKSGGIKVKVDAVGCYKWTVCEWKQNKTKIKYWWNVFMAN